VKIVIFEPHPDDLLFGPGPKIFDWIKKGYDIHIITVTDGRACYKDHNNIKITEDEVAEKRINEAKDAINFLGIPIDNHYLLYFHDEKGQEYVKEGIKKVKPIIKDADRIVLPSNNNGHIDHQATHDIAMGAAKELGLDIEYFVYFIPSYGIFKDDSGDKQIEVLISDDLRIKLQEWYDIYQSQKLPISSFKFYTRYLKRVKKTIYGIFTLKDKGNYYNF
jgi:LmbE family N-acetylglucosaminyl deacetylase